MYHWKPKVLRFKLYDEVVCIPDGRRGVISSISVKGGFRYFVVGEGFEGWFGEDSLQSVIVEIVEVPKKIGRVFEKRTCEKKGYASKRSAQDAIAGWRRRSSRSKIPVRSYFCEKCRMYHLTSRKY